MGPAEPRADTTVLAGGGRSAWKRWTPILLVPLASATLLAYLWALQVRGAREEWRTLLSAKAEGAELLF